MKVYRKGHKYRPGPESFTFPNQVAELSDDTIKNLKMGPALKRFCFQLLEQMGEKTIGVEISGIDFHRILAKETP